jgi:hypothetical protein
MDYGRFGGESICFQRRILLNALPQHKDTAQASLVIPSGARNLSSSLGGGGLSPRETVSHPKTGFSP